MKDLIRRSIREGSIQLWRNKFLSGTTVLLGALIIFLLNFVFAVSYYTDLSLQNLEKRADFNIPLSTDIDILQFQYGALENELNQEFNLTLKRLEEQVYPDFTVPERLNIKFSNLEEVAPVFETIKKARYVELFGKWDGLMEREFVTQIDKLLRFRTAVDQAAFWLVIIFAVGGMLIMINTFRIVLFARRNEVRIARLVGADTSFIVGPFIWEAWLMGMIASLIGIVAFIFVLREIDFLPGADIFIHLWNDRFSYQIFGSAFVAVLGGWVALRRYLNGDFSD